MSITNYKNMLTYATIAVVAEHKSVMTLAFIHFIVNVVAILSTRISIFTTT